MTGWNDYQDVKSFCDFGGYFCNWMFDAYDANMKGIDQLAQKLYGYDAGQVSIAIDFPGIGPRVFVPVNLLSQRAILSGDINSAAIDDNDRRKAYTPDHDWVSIGYGVWADRISETYSFYIHMLASKLPNFKKSSEYDIVEFSMKNPHGKFYPFEHAMVVEIIRNIIKWHKFVNKSSI